MISLFAFDRATTSPYAGDSIDSTRPTRSPYEVDDRDSPKCAATSSSAVLLAHTRNAFNVGVYRTSCGSKKQ